MKERLLSLFQTHFEDRPEAFLELGADGSARQYFRFVRKDGNTVLGAIGPDLEENAAFLSFAEAFRSIGLPVPEVLAEDREAGVWLLEDLGDATLFAVLSNLRISCQEGHFPAEAEALYRKTLAILPRFQILGHRVIDYEVAYPRKAFDERSMRWDLNYFKYHFLRLTHLEFNERRLEDDFDRLIDLLIRAESDFFLYRDFQSRNIMIREGEPWFIDFQGGRRGPLQYDVASLLYDAKADIPEEVRARLLEVYMDALEEHLSFDRQEFKDQYRAFVLVRILQALGTYGYRGFFERKQHFLNSVPFAAKNLQTILAQGLPIQLPELKVVLERIVDRWAEPSEKGESSGRLTLLIHSFSFKKGYPIDSAGHGGGHVFDCRALPNPGRHAEMKDLTGESPSVSDFLEKAPEVQEFWASVREIVDNHLSNFTQRSFESLTVSFGCTGGQHRSVFFAQKLATHVRDRFPKVDLCLRHREI